MSNSFTDRLQQTIARYRDWASHRSIRDCRLIQYCGVELQGTVNVPVEEIEAQIERVVSEGFCIDWFDDNGRLYVYVWEFDDPRPDRTSVVREEHLADVDALRRIASLGND